MRIDHERYLPKETRALVVRLVLGVLVVHLLTGIPGYLFTDVPARQALVVGWSRAGLRFALAAAALLVLMKPLRFPRSLWVLVALSESLDFVVTTLSRVLFVASQSLVPGMNTFGGFIGQIGVSAAAHAPAVLAALVVGSALFVADRTRDGEALFRALPDDAEDLVDWGFLGRLVAECFAPYADAEERRLVLWLALLPAIETVVVSVFETPVDVAWSLLAIRPPSTAADTLQMAQPYIQVFAIGLACLLTVWFAVGRLRAPRASWLGIAAGALAGLLALPLNLLIPGQRMPVLLMLWELLVVAVILSACLLGVRIATRERPGGHDGDDAAAIEQPELAEEPMPLRRRSAE